MASDVALAELASPLDVKPLRIDFAPITERELGAPFEVVGFGVSAETCYSDSGGPLLRRNGNKRTVVGVVSAGFPGATSSCLKLGTKFSVFGVATRSFLAAFDL